MKWFEDFENARTVAGAGTYQFAYLPNDLVSSRTVTDTSGVVQKTNYTYNGAGNLLEANSNAVLEALTCSASGHCEVFCPRTRHYEFW
jgi:YD repeat-containing protein